jgi:hypothetical protein
MHSHPHQLTLPNMLPFMVAGKAVFTARGREKRFTFRIKTPKFDGVQAKNMRFVSVLTGPDNTSSYTFFGILVLKHGTWEFRFSSKARIEAGAQSVQAFKYVFRHVLEGRPMPEVEVWHQGKCGRCGHPLTVPESIETGLGPVCENL